MRAHVIKDNFIVNTIEVESLDFMPGLIEATDGAIGWQYENGVFIAPESGPIIPSFDILSTDTWAIPADATTPATVTYTDQETVYFSVNEQSHAVEPIDYVATLEITADAPGPIRVEVKDKQLIITALEVPL